MLIAVSFLGAVVFGGLWLMIVPRYSALDAPPKEMTEKDPHPAPATISQQSSGANSPNIMTFGPNSPVTLHSSLPDRHLTEAQVQSIGAFASQISTDTAKKICVFHINDSEAGTFGLEIDEAFRRFSKPLDDHLVALAPDPRLRGIVLLLHAENDSALPMAREFGAALIKTGVPVQLAVDDGIESGHFWIFIGPRQ